MEKEIIGDLHIHSRFSRACSKNITIENLVKWARVKGLGLLGTGDFTHPEWLKEIKEKLKDEDKTGIYYYENKEGGFPFILSSEISLVYTQNGKGHRVHLLYLAPSLEAVDKINLWLDSLGRRDYDGRPIFKISCRDFVAKMQEIDERIEVIPAHIWTSWFGVFGSKSGFNSLDEAFGDMRKHIHAIETGLSSDPEMNWKIKDLENISLISFSDSHSFWPFRLGREATIFVLRDNELLSYEFIIEQIRNKKFKATIEVNPAYGIYHYDGHKDCKFSCSPAKTKELGGICPVCNKPLTIGVENRVEELADKERWFMPQYAKPFYKILPLHEIIALSIGSSVSSKSTWKIYDELIKNFGTELNILLNAKMDELAKINKNELFIELIMKNRVGNIKVKPGYDGVYGIPILPGKVETQKKLV
ncbi:MAG: endonuclease Q family protein [Nanoarchaeota archaeon]